MIHNIVLLKGFLIVARDGEIGSVYDCYFDDESWTIRYLAIDTGGWLNGRQVLISPYAVTYVDWELKRVAVSLTKKQVEDSPGVDTHEPVSRQHEAAYLSYFGYPNYWNGPYLWGSSYNPGELLSPPVYTPEAIADHIRRASADSHLRSVEAVTGYHIEAVDGEIGHVCAFLVDSEAWGIRYLEVATRNWWPGKKVLVAPSWVHRVSWEDSKIYVDLPRAAIQAAHEYDDTIPISREHEEILHKHYGRPPYWHHEGQFRPPAA